MSEPQRRTIDDWVYSLERPGAELTLSEFMALCLLHIRENVKDARLGTQHLEGMVGTFDALFAATHPLYGELASKRAAPVPAFPREDGDFSG